MTRPYLYPVISKNCHNYNSARIFQTRKRRPLPRYRRSPPRPERRAVPTSTCGSSSRNCWRPPRCTVRASGGWIARAASSRSRTPSRWPASGARGRTARPWTTTSWAAPSGSTTRRASWRRRRGRRGWCTSFATRTVSEPPPTTCLLVHIVTILFIVRGKVTRSIRWGWFGSVRFVYRLRWHFEVIEMLPVDRSVSSWGITAGRFVDLKRQLGF